ncbi:hypothetical protein Poli38472_003736 [Pythium oligandrum]|uniref:Tafazzin family protein n=1 Tax=Pythium oligandrum TaxID=41045 RepID=A0A8K1FKE6_PYTOL|nr:hypothetical protein Poli38472_003736 [Pythium oligandrum]|eukprot:TMW65971.1 hypothetical protein Poli38472_003736 [Pythium oligandrum]
MTTSTHGSHVTAISPAITTRNAVMLRRALQTASLAGLSAVTAGGIALYVDAPDGDRGDGQFDPTRRHDRCHEWLHDLGRVPLFALATGVSKVYLKYLSNTTVEGFENLHKHLEERPANTPLITVSNHTATVDDPAVFATILPWKYALPWYARWSLVSQEYSYTRGRLLRAFFFSAKALPIKRGAGINQPMLASLFEKVQQGNWVHIFPEGKIEQRMILGGRSGPRTKEIGRLKWGVGKLVARADVRPVVVPIYHTNMQKIMPQDEDNHIISMIPQFGANITIRVGKPISFDDLFEKHRDGRVVGSVAEWETQEREEALYSAITMRIEESLLDLARDIYEE